jgi:hypothetical protein
MPKISNKTFRELCSLVYDVISLNSVEEFEEFKECEDGDKLFEGPPASWSEIENSICDYQARIEGALLAGIKSIFGKEDK